MEIKGEAAKGRDFFNVPLIKIESWRLLPGLNYILWVSLCSLCLGGESFSQPLPKNHSIYTYAANFSTFTAQALYSGILATGS